MNDNWLIFCEESGDKAIPWKNGSSHYYVITAILVKERDEQSFIGSITKNKNKILRMRAPLEWKKLNTKQKKDDILLAKFFKRIECESPGFLITQVICDKNMTYGEGMKDTQTFMNYLYGLIFKRISWFLSRTNSSAKLIIDRNTDSLAQMSLKNYLSNGGC